MKQISIFILFSFLSSNVFALDLDEKLDLIISVHKLTAKQCANRNKRSNRIEIGKVFFESTAISGNNDMSCSVCHLDKFGSADGIPIAVGAMGEGEGPQRYKHGQGALVQRNALSLIGRAHPDFRSYFWDGKVEQEGNFTISQFGEFISKKFNSILSVAAIMPILERDELMGTTTNIFKRNEIADEVGDKLYNNRYNSISKIIKKRIYESDDPEIIQLKNSLESIGTIKENFELADVGNLLADFIEDKFQCTESKWDQYLQGNINILSKEEKAGAVLFFGKGKCSSCHSGNLFSDFEFHSIGSPQGYFGPHARHRDIGRAGVTNRANDKFKFKTPPLIEVSKTAPYGHSGAFPTLFDIVLYHINPIEFYKNNDEYSKADYFIIGKLLNSRDRVLSTVDLDKMEEMVQIIAFLQTL